MKLGKRFREGEKIPRGTWTIGYWPTGGCSILNDVSAAYEHTYELLDFEIPPKPLEPEVGKWYLVETPRGSTKCLRKYNGPHCALTDPDGDMRELPPRCIFIEEWAPVKR